MVIDDARIRAMESRDRERVADVYASEDYPVLLAVAKIELTADGPVKVIAGTASDAPKPPLAERVGRSVDAVNRSLLRLLRGGLIEGRVGTTGMVLATGLTVEGLREVGAWPRAQSLAQGLRLVLQEEAQRLERSEPEKASRVKVVLEQLEDLGTSFTAKLSAELIKWMATGH